MTATRTNLFGLIMRRGLVLTAGLVAALTLHAQQTEQRKASEQTAGPKDTATCIKEAAQMNSAVVRFGQLATEKAQNAELKRFGQEIAQDHQKALTKLEPIASKHNVTLPTTLDQHCQEELSKLQKLSGSEFDKEFAKGMVQGHAMGIAHLEKAVSESKDADLTQYAKDQLALLKRHQVRGREVAKTVGLDQATIAKLETETPEGVGAPGASQSERGTSSPQTDQKDRPSTPGEPKSP